MANVIMKMFTVPGKPNKNNTLIPKDVFEDALKRAHTMIGTGVIYLTDSKLNQRADLGVPPDRIIGNINFNLGYNKEFVNGAHDTVNVTVTNLDYLNILTSGMYEIKLQYLAKLVRQGNAESGNGASVATNVRFIYAFLSRKDM